MARRALGLADPSALRRRLACGSLAFVGGQVSLDEHAQVIAPDNLEAQTGQALRNIGRVLAELGMAPTDLVKLSAFFADTPVDASAGGSIARLIRRFAGADPVVTCVPLPYLSYPEMRVEIEAIAWRDRDPPDLAPLGEGKRPEMQRAFSFGRDGPPRRCAALASP